MVDLQTTFESLHCTFVRAVSTEDEILPHPLLLQYLRHVCNFRVASVADEHCTALCVNVSDSLGRELHPLIWLHHTLVAALDAIDAANTVVPQGVHDFANDGIQSRANATTTDNGCTRHRIVGVEVQALPGACTEHLVVRLRLATVTITSDRGLCHPRVNVLELTCEPGLQRRGDAEVAKPVTQVEALQEPDLCACGQQVRAL
mmetsp:Transcript_118641/g.308253  ORF Transcript_118641/g.308253 Transcript_118641/m.308253 type:complete len:203 (+) Transcript_118641:5549-6157(+)